MITRILLIGVLSLMVLPTYAQFGLSADIGLNYNQSVFTQTIILRGQGQINGTVGLEASALFGKRFRVYGRFDLYQATVKIESVNFNRYRHTYLSLSPMVGWQWAPSFETMFGFYVAPNMGERFEVDGAWQKIPENIETDQPPSDLGLKIGARYRIARFYVQTYYLFGLADVDAFSFTDANGTIIPVGERHRQIQLGFGYYIIDPQQKE
ncbi:MAG: outer membrane beta-barrel protein [Bacteroidota bacterium]